MKFAAFIVKEALEIGKDTALMQSMPFEEKQVIETNQAYLFEGMQNIKNVQVLLKEDEAVDAVPNARMMADNAVPGKPSIMFY